MGSTLTYSGELTIVTCWCGIKHAYPTQLRETQINQKNNGKPVMGVYCPLGHLGYPAGETKAEKLQKELEFERQRVQRERAEHDQTKAALRETERRRVAQKGVSTRIKNRVSKGVCPCCNRYFANLHKHMSNQHPDFTAPKEDEVK